MKQNFVFTLLSMTAIIICQLLSTNLCAQTLPECEIEALLPQHPPEYPKTLCQRFQEIQVPPHQIEPPPIILGIPGWQTDLDVLLQTGSWVLTNKKIFVQGNFTVTTNFEFNNCWVQISPGIQIIVGNGAGSQPLLTVNNSRLFCCYGLWAGINLEQNARINTQNNSEIEDATTAIIADADANTLSLQSTTFNRNRVGVQLGKTGNSSGTSITMVNFSSNKFTCTSPLNTTISEITFAGILVQRTTGTTSLTGISEFIKIHYGIFVGVHLQAITQAQTFLTINGSKFDRIIQKGIFTEPPMVMTVVGCNFINNGTHCVDVLKADQLQVGWCHVTYNDDVISNTDNFYYGIRFNPFGSDLVFNDQNIHDNIFDIDFSTPFKHESIHCISMYGASDGARGDHSIDYNIFNMNFSPGQGETAETRAISIIGGIHPYLTENTILENHFKFESLGPNLPSCAINVTNGDYSNMQIAGNQFHHSNLLLPFPFGETCIRLKGSTGSDNMVRVNTIDEDHLGPLNDYNFGIYAMDFDNTTYEYNTIRKCDTGFFYHGTDENTVMICNDIIGGKELLKLDLAIIGAQGGPLDINGIPLSTNGNEWTNVEVPTFDANCTPSTLADFSKFFVPGTQSMSNSFFPDQINPSANWFLGNGPSSNCVFASNQNPLERSIVNGELEAAINNPTDTWESERYLLNRLISDGDLLNSWPGFQAFKNAKESTSMGQLSAVQKLINDAYVPSSSLAIQADQKKNEMDALLDQAKQLDDQISNGETSNLLAQRAQIQANLALRQGEVAALDAAYQSEIATKLQAAQSANNAILVTSIYEINTKTINGLVIDLALYGFLGEAQVNTLKAIAAQCPRTGGMAVYKARGILPDCELQLINEDICYPLEEHNGKFDSERLSEKVRIIPNPNNGEFLIRAIDLAGSRISIFDIFGNLVTEQRINNETPTYSINLKPGTYYCHISGADGQNRGIPFVVIR